MNITAKTKTFYNPEIIKNSLNYDFYGDDSREDLHWGKLFLQLFNQFHSVIFIHHEIDRLGYLEELKKIYPIKKEKIISIEYKYSFIGDTEDSHKNETFTILKDALCISISKNGIYILFGHEIQRSELDNLLEIADKYKIIEEDEPRRFFMISKSSLGFELKGFDIKQCEIDIEKSYNDDFLPIYEVIKKALLNEDKSGIILAHGVAGSGKTFFIRHLICTVDAKFIFVPSEMISCISSPDFIPFISRHKNAILILEDCEKLLASRNGGNNHIQAISNLLNLTDGLLADALGVKVICTFNANLNKIDDALLRKGRLIARYEFKELEIQKANELAKKLGITKPIEQPTTLADLYNYNDIDFRETKSKIGFKTIQFSC